MGDATDRDRRRRVIAELIESGRRRGELNGFESAEVGAATALEIEEELTDEDVDRRYVAIAREEINQARREAFRTFVEVLFADGIHPASVIRRAFWLAYKFAPEKTEGLRQRELALILGETEGAFCRRMEIYETRFDVRGLTSGCHTEERRAQKAKGMKGNKNRSAGSMIRRAVEKAKRQ